MNNIPQTEKTLQINYTEEADIRLDVYLSHSNIEELYSRSQIDKLIADGKITVNGKQEKKSYKLNAGDEIRIFIPKPVSSEILPQDIPLEIIYQDEYLVVINKQAGIAVHPGTGIADGTLVNALMYNFCGKLSSGSDVSRPGIVHRLDKDTTGLIIVAKDDRTHSLLGELFRQNSIKKTYLAILCGVPSKPEATIENLLNRSKSDRTRMAVSKVGRKAITHYKVLQDYHFFSVVQIGLETGRTHQIRVQFAHLNCPVLGDQVYSSLKRTLSLVPEHYHKKVKYLLSRHLKRQALHAAELEFIHPVSEEKIKLEAPLPQDIIYTMNWLEKNFGE